jgi:hypothetical protein
MAVGGVGKGVGAFSKAVGAFLASPLRHGSIPVRLTNIRYS